MSSGEPDYMQEERDEYAMETEPEAEIDYASDDPLYQELKNVTTALHAYAVDESDSDAENLLMVDVQPFYALVLAEAQKSGIESPELNELWRLYNHYWDEFKKTKDSTDIKQAIDKLKTIHQLVLKSQVGDDDGGLVGQDYSELPLEELLGKRELIDMINAAMVEPGNEIPFGFDTQSALDYIARVLNPVCLQFSRAHNLMADPVGPENILLPKFLESLGLPPKKLKILKQLVPHKGKAQDAFRRRGSAIQLADSINEVIAELQQDWDGEPIREDTAARLKLDDPEVAKQFIMQAFLLPLQALNMRADELLSVSEKKLKIKQKYRDDIKIPLNSPLDYVMRHYYGGALQNLLLTFTSDHSRMAMDAKRIAKGKRPAMTAGGPSKKNLAAHLAATRYEPFTNDDLAVRLDFATYMFNNHRWYIDEFQKDPLELVNTVSGEGPWEGHPQYRFMSNTSKRRLLHYMTTTLGFTPNPQSFGQWFKQQQVLITPERYEEQNKSPEVAYDVFFSQRLRAYLYKVAHKSGGIKVNERRLNNQIIWSVGQNPNIGQNLADWYALEKSKGNKE